MQTTTSHGRRAGLEAGSPGPARGARWRALLETRWQARLREVTELALAYHEAEAAQEDGTSGGRERTLRPEPSAAADGRVPPGTGGHRRGTRPAVGWHLRLV